MENFLNFLAAKIHLRHNPNKKIPPADTKSDKTRYQQEEFIYESNRDSKTDRWSGAGGYTQGDTQDDAHQGRRPVTDYIDTVGKILLRHARFSQTSRLVAVHSDEEWLRDDGYSRWWNISVFCTRTRNLDSRTLLTENLMCIRQRHISRETTDGKNPVCCFMWKPWEKFTCHLVILQSECYTLLGK